MIIRNYHAENGRFSDNNFINSLNTHWQKISHCGVNAHFQNRIAGKSTRELQEQERKHILHAWSIWISTIELKLWPYAIQNANEIRNNLPDKDNTTSPVERYSQVQVSPKIRCHHTFRCPAYALSDHLQSGGWHNKWESRSRLGINLGHSPRHA